MVQNEEYEKMFRENQDTLNVDDQELQGIGQTTSSEISPKKPIKNVKINAFGDTGTDEIATSFTDEDLCQIEKDPMTGTLPLPIAGIQGVTSSILDEDPDPLGRLKELEKEKLQNKVKAKKKTNFKFR